MPNDNQDPKPLAPLPLFVGYDELVKEVSSSDPAKIHCLFTEAERRLAAATPAQLASELRHPTSSFVRSQTEREALARIIEWMNF